MKVHLQTSLDYLLPILYQAARTCYSEGNPSAYRETDQANALKLVKKCFDSGHLSIAEHFNMTFYIEGISRACSHQLVRHRHMSFSQQSQRYVRFDKPDYVVPDSIRKNRKADALYNKVLDDITAAYKELLAEGIKAEDARFLLPNATCTNITVTMNLRTLMEYCNKRLCSRAQSEIRTMTHQMVTEVILRHPWLNDYLVPNCRKLGYCPEEKSCGAMKKKGE